MRRIKDPIEDALEAMLYALKWVAGVLFVLDILLISMERSPL